MVMPDGAAASPLLRRCYEIACDNQRVYDGYGQGFDRNVCYDTSSSVVVTITDRCAHAARRHARRRRPHLPALMMMRASLNLRPCSPPSLARSCECYYPPNEWSNRRWYGYSAAKPRCWHPAGCQALSKRAVCGLAEGGLLMRAALCGCRRCCQANHVDLSVWAFEKLADKKWGVMGIK
jgi:hypothetical protein